MSRFLTPYWVLAVDSEQVLRAYAASLAFITVVMPARMPAISGQGRYQAIGYPAAGKTPACAGMTQKAPIKPDLAIAPCNTLLLLTAGSALGN